MPHVDDGLLEIDNNWAERTLRIVALGRKNYLFAGSNAGDERAAVIYSLLGRAKVNTARPKEHAMPFCRAIRTDSVDCLPAYGKARSFRRVSNRQRPHSVLSGCGTCDDEAPPEFNVPPAELRLPLWPCQRGLAGRAGTTATL